MKSFHHAIFNLNRSMGSAIPKHATVEPPQCQHCVVQILGSLSRESQREKEGQEKALHLPPPPKACRCHYSSHSSLSTTSRPSGHVVLGTPMPSGATEGNNQSTSAGQSPELCFPEHTHTLSHEGSLKDVGLVTFSQPYHTGL